MNELHIDINCDMGESYGRFKIGNDEQVFPYISSCNIACGFHGGDPLTIEATIRKALEHGVQIGAHPSYPDLSGFGRRNMQMPHAELKAAVKYQIAAVKGMAESAGGKLTYVKPHGALYNTAADNEAVALAVIAAVREIHPGLALMGLAGSAIEVWAAKEGITFIPEAFADRRYEPDGQLMSRSKAGSVLKTPEQAVEQVLSLVFKKCVIASDGTSVPVEAQSICIHGDNEGAVNILKAIHEALARNHIAKKAFALP